MCPVHEYPEKSCHYTLWTCLLLEMRLGLVQRATRVSALSEQVSSSGRPACGQFGDLKLQ
jgi:hypothetical protein